MDSNNQNALGGYGLEPAVYTLTTQPQGEGDTATHPLHGESGQQPQEVEVPPGIWCNCRKCKNPK